MNAFAKLTDQQGRQLRIKLDSIVVYAQSPKAESQTLVWVQGDSDEFWVQQSVSDLDSMFLMAYRSVDEARS